tara:strand:- start:44 stop:2131 length:2088 start_codon:yes stop_codon:yes gene_type:complete
MNDEDNVTGGDLAKAITFEVAANTLLDKYTAGLLAAPDPSLISKGIYALANVGGSAAINYFAQRIRGGEFNLGELLTAGGLSLVPGGVQAKTLSGRVVRGTTKGAGLGALQVTGESLINEGKPPELQDLALGATFGGGLGGALSGVSGPEASKFFKALKNRLNRKKLVVQQIQEQVAQQKPQKNLGGYMDDEGIDIEDYGFGPEGPRGGATDDQIMQAYRERTGELDLDPSRRIVGEPISAASGFTKKANEFNDYVEKAYQYRLNRLQERKANLMKGFDEVIQNDSGQDVILQKRRRLVNKENPAAKENYVPKLKFDVERDIIARSGYEVKQDEDVKYLQLIRRELNKIEQQNPKLYLTNLMEYGDSAYLEHKVARRQAGQFWDRVEGQREDDIANGLFQWTGTTKRNSLKNLRLLFDPNYKKLKDRIEVRLIELEPELNLKSNGDPEGFIITIEDPNEAVFSAKSQFVRSNPGNIQIRKAGTGEVVGIIPDFYRQIYSTQFADAFNARKLALTGGDVPNNLRAQGQEAIDVYRNNVLDRMLKEILTGEVSMLGREQAYLDELAEFYNFFGKLEDSTGIQWVRKPRWVDEIITGKNNFADPAEADIEDFNVRDQTRQPRQPTREEELARIRRDELADLLKNMPREQGGKFKGKYFTSKRKAVAEIRKEIQELEAEFNIGNALEGTNAVQEKLDNI